MPYSKPSLSPVLMVADRTSSPCANPHSDRVVRALGNNRITDVLHIGVNGRMEA